MEARDSGALEERIRAALAQGRTRDQIYAELLASGWPLGAVADAFYRVAPQAALDYPPLQEYIRSSLALGKSKEAIFAELLAAGWPLEFVNANFAAASQDRASPVAARPAPVRLFPGAGAVLVALGVFMFISANWHRIGREVRLGAVLASMVASYLLGWRLKTRTALKTTGDALVVLGALLYGVGILLAFRMYRVGLNLPDAFVLWAGGCLLTAWAARLRSLLYLTLSLLWVAALGYLFGSSIRDAVPQTRLYVSTVLVIVAAAASFWAALEVRKIGAPGRDAFEG